MQNREIELGQKIRKKLQEGAELVGEKLFKECFDFFQRKSQYNDELNGKDMQEI